VPSESLIPSLDPPLQGFEELPELKNRRQVEAWFRRRYPPELRRRGVEGMVGVLIHIDREGRVDRVRMQGPSPYETLNRLAMELAEERRYRPARKDGEPVDNWFYIRMEYPPGE
jgi:TonB family protein